GALRGLHEERRALRLAGADDRARRLEVEDVEAAQGPTFAPGARQMLARVHQHGRSSCLRPTAARKASPHRHSMKRRIETVSYCVESTNPRFAHGDTTIAGTRLESPQRSTAGGPTWSKKPP